MKARAVTRVVLAAALAFPASLTGCSLLASRPPPETPLVFADQCSARHFAPVLDTIVTVNAAGLALLVLGAAAIQDQDNRTTIVPSWDQKPLSVDSSLLVLGGLSTAATIAFAASAAYGYKSAHDCGEARFELIRTHPPAWPPGPAYPYGYPPWMSPPPPLPPPSPGGQRFWSIPAPSTEVPSAPRDVSPPPPPPTPTGKRSASVVAPSAQVRSAPFIVAPIVVVLAQGQRLFVDATPNAGWRVAALLDGRVGYIQDAQVKVDSP